MRITTLTLAAALLAGIAPVAMAQTSTSTAASTISDSDRAYLTEASQGSAYELALASAAQKSDRADVRAYAERLVRDHTTYNAALKSLAQAKGITLPDGMKASDQAKVASLAQGNMGNSAFIEEAVRINADDKKTSAAEAASTQDADIKAFLKRFESVDAEHERMAMALNK